MNISRTRAGIGITVVALLVTWTAADAYLIKRGDTLSGIARAHGTTVEEIVEANGIANPDLIYAGDHIMVPGERITLSGRDGRGRGVRGRMIPRNGFDEVKPGQLSPVGIGQCLLYAGFSRGDLAYWIAVGLAESSGLTGVHGDVNIQTGTWGPSVGVFQVRSLWSQKGTGKWRDINALTDPAFNCRAAWEISEHGATSYPWGASKHHDGRYAEFMDVARKAAKKLQ